MDLLQVNPHDIKEEVAVCIKSFISWEFALRRVELFIHLALANSIIRKRAGRFSSTFWMSDKGSKLLIIYHVFFACGLFDASYARLTWLALGYNSL